MKIMHVVGARPNFMKISPLIREMDRFPKEFKQILIHTGQHYDNCMSEAFFNELGLPRPDVNLEVGSGSHAWQTAQIMLRFEKVVEEYKPDWVIVPGDVNSTLACALVCSKLGIKVAHLEAGLRSFDRSMPEEINRILTDQVSELLFTPSLDGNDNLLREGVAPEKIHFVGNIMIDTLVRLLPLAEQRWPSFQEKFGLDRYILITIHRPANVDNPQSLQEIFSALLELSERWKIIFPVHPRTQNRLRGLGQSGNAENLILLEPLGYLDFLALEAHASSVVTDSGGVQEETSFLKIPCITVRPNTERPVTIHQGTNRLVKNKCLAIINAVEDCLTNNRRGGKIPEFWDGKTAGRITAIFQNMI